MKYILTLICLFVLTGSYSQYYFNDIVSIQASNDQFRSLRANKVKKIKATSYEADNTVTEGFSLEEEISMDGKRVILSTAISSGRSAVVNRFYELNKLRRTQTTSNRIDNKTEYTYTEKGQVQKIVFTTTDTAMKSTLTEVHEWAYNEKSEPAFMLRIKNKTDTTVIELVKDEQGLVAEEKWKKKNRVLETYYYYYDANKQLTDIVRFNAKLKKLLPDFQYAYDEKGRVSQMTQVSMSSASYLIWKYTYNEKGLKQNEVGFDKEKKMVGRIEYTYE